MKKVLIIKNWDCPDIFRQTPKGKGIWKDIKFTLDSSLECDYVVVLNYPPQKISLYTYPENIWVLHQEPPNEFFKPFHKANKIYRRVFTSDPDLKEERYIHTQPAIPWLVDKTYDFLKKTQISKKDKSISWITSNKKNFLGHKKRMRFLEKIHSLLAFDLFGRGFKSIKDKWEGLVSYKYSLVVESWVGPDYFSEKLIDCFLSWTMPIYYGCININDYFPQDSLIQIDIDDRNVVEKIEKIVKSDLWSKKREAIEKARNLVLDKYQLFPFIFDEIKKWEKKFPLKSLKKKEVIIPHESNFLNRLRFRARRFFNPAEWILYGQRHI